METQFIFKLIFLAIYTMCQIHATELSWGMGRQLVLDPTRICPKTRRLRGRQAVICRKEQEIVKEISKGVQLGTKECQFQFRNRRWNCTSARRSMKKVLMRDTRETGYVHAITAAGVVHSISQACSSGALLDCSCDRLASKALTAGQGFEWRGCSDNIEYGYRKSKEFLDAQLKKRSDVKTMVLLHNYEAGRLAVKNYMRTVCKCHGMSGSCTFKTCWRKLPVFRDVGDRLKERFDGAAKITAGNDGKGFVPIDPMLKHPSKEDLVYSEESPSYCDFNRKTGSLGTRGRVCNVTSTGVDGCDLLCCGRGYETIRTQEHINCRCRFEWCCNVTCDTCIVNKTIHRCL